ncbi:hypothetical protein B0F90DRAFT_1669085 [Multifurca ochricompacta]|uniref:Uncharacterized protein n=1 Tax=Multifurca ochricompacta TaxID=376703 RepID=A0AAD4M1C7_9AGAM|nr:hypothetical protein B0F90DRAFT_1669085 [Multifurca ochricompacta]
MFFSERSRQKRRALRGSSTPRIPTSLSNTNSRENVGYTIRYSGARGKGITAEFQLGKWKCLGVDYESGCLSKIFLEEVCQPPPERVGIWQGRLGTAEHYFTIPVVQIGSSSLSLVDVVLYICRTTLFRSGFLWHGAKCDPGSFLTVGRHLKTTKKPVTN